MNNFKILFIALAAIALSLSACKKDDPEIENEEEVITTLNYTLTGGGSTVTLSFVDADGEGGNDPVVTGGTLAANTTYSGSIELRNDIEGEDITEEIEDEDDEHQFFFEATGGISVDYNSEDVDGDGNPVGLQNILTTGAAGTGSVKVTLRHEPDKNASGVSDGDITNAGGETDIEVTFDVTVM